MWNYRLVRRKHTTKKSRNRPANVHHTYGIYETYYDEKGHAVAIAETPEPVYGENPEEARHTWVMMAEAFGYDMLDYEDIPESTCTCKENPFDISPIDMYLAKKKSPPIKRVTKEQSARYDAMAEKGRVEKERLHNKNYVGTSTLRQLVDKLYSDYRRCVKSAKHTNQLKKKSDA